MDYTFKEFIPYTFSEFLDEYDEHIKSINEQPSTILNNPMTMMMGKRPKGEEPKAVDKKVKFFAIKGRPVPITKKDYERVAGGQKKIVKKAGMVIATDNYGKKFYIKKPVKKGMTVQFDPQKSKFVYRFDLHAYKVRRRAARKALKKSLKKRVMKFKRTMAMRKRRK